MVERVNIPGAAEILTMVCTHRKYWVRTGESVGKPLCNVLTNNSCIGEKKAATSVLEGQELMFCFKTKLSQNPDFFSVFNSSFNRKLVLQEMKELSVGDQSS